MSTLSLRQYVVSSSCEGKIFPFAFFFFFFFLIHYFPRAFASSCLSVRSLQHSLWRLTEREEGEREEDGARREKERMEEEKIERREANSERWRFYRWFDVRTADRPFTVCREWEKERGIKRKTEDRRRRREKRTSFESQGSIEEGKTVWDDRRREWNEGNSFCFCSLFSAGRKRREEK